MLATVPKEGTGAARVTEAVATGGSAETVTQVVATNSVATAIKEATAATTLGLKVTAHLAKATDNLNKATEPLVLRAAATSRVPCLSATSATLTTAAPSSCSTQWDLTQLTCA